MPGMGCVIYIPRTTSAWMEPGSAIISFTMGDPMLYGFRPYLAIHLVDLRGFLRQLQGLPQT